ncbi:MAG: N-acetylmuramoyl-L-alanine amidase [candidate division Zixibacteria bacterium]|nr:N-acetylmuramoyl-L-alanine amidase [candidate division Zixibacteria bacterium]
MNRQILTYTLLLGLLLASAITYASEIKVRTSGGTEKIAAIGTGNKTYYSLSELNKTLNGKISWVTIGYSVKYVVDSYVYLFTVDSPYFNMNGKVYNLIHPIKIIKGALYVPAEAFTPYLNMARAENITWDNSGNTLRIDAEWFNITDVAVMSKTNGVLLEIFMTSQLIFEVYESEGNWLNINFPYAKINKNKILSGIDKKYIRSVNAFQFDSSAQVSFRLRRGYKKYYHTYKPNPIRLQISIEDVLFNPDSLNTDVNRIGPDEKIDVIVIDPGHGGKDYGAIGRGKRTREKDINLEIAKNLAKMIRKDKQFKVIMTRTKDKYVSLDERAKIANDAQADLFISIHCNASSKAQPNGHQVFYLAPAKTDAARAAAQLENAPFLLDDPTVEGENQDDLAFILNDMIQTQFLSESADLAYMCDVEMRKKIKIRPRGVDHAAFFVLNRVYMPSILVEAAFISNKKEEKLLRKKSFRKKVAEGIYEAVKRFKAKYERM